MADYANEVQTFTLSPEDGDSANADVLEFVTESEATPQVTAYNPSSGGYPTVPVGFTVDIVFTV